MPEFLTVTSDRLPYPLIPLNKMLHMQFAADVWEHIQRSAFAGQNAVAQGIIRENKFEDQRIADV